MLIFLILLVSFLIVYTNLLATKFWTY